MTLPTLGADIFFFCMVAPIALTALLLSGKIPGWWVLCSIAAKFAAWGAGTYLVFLMRLEWYKDNGYLALEKIGTLTTCWFVGLCLGILLAIACIAFDSKRDRPSPE